MDIISESKIREVVASVLMNASERSRISGSFATVQEVGNPIKCNGDRNQKMVIAIGSDHGGFELKTDLIKYIQELGHEVRDCGTNSTESVDYPDFALAVAEMVHGHKACRGIVIDAAGIGSAIAANKVPGIRAAMCYDYATARNSREHNHANVLSLGAGLIGFNQVKLIVKTWLETEEGGDRHARRVDKINAIEKKYSKEM